MINYSKFITIIHDSFNKCGFIYYLINFIDLKKFFFPLFLISMRKRWVKGAVKKIK